MRRKPLNNNPNSMHMIMENFRRFQNVLDDMGGPADNKVYLFESNNPVPTVVLLDEIERRFDSKKLEIP